MVQVTDEGLSQAGRWTDLTTLDLWENMRLTDRTLLAASSCGKLETVRLCGRAFTDSGMRSLASGCPGTVADHAFSFLLSFVGLPSCRVSCAVCVPSSSFAYALPRPSFVSFLFRPSCP